MKKDETMNYALREVKRRKARTTSIIAGYTVAVASLLIIISWLSYAQATFIERLREVGAHLVAFKTNDDFCCPTGEDESEGLIITNMITELFPTQHVIDIDDIPAVLEASPYISYRFKDPSYGFNYKVGGFDPTKQISFGATVAMPRNIIAGRFLQESDRQVVMLHYMFAEVRGLEVGSVIPVGGEFFEVIGIVRPPLRPVKPDVMMHIEDAARIVGNYINMPFNYLQIVNGVLVETVDASTYPAAARDIERMGFFAFGYGCNVPAAGAMGMNRSSTILLMILITIGTVLFSGKTQHGSVVERQHDIGILKAIGWSNGRIVKQIVLESVIQAFWGSIVGVIIAVIIVYLVPLKSITGVDMGVDFSLSWVHIVAAILLAIIAGIISSLFPAWSAAKKNPADAIRHL